MNFCPSNSADVQDLSVLEDGKIEIHGLFGLAIEPQKGRDCLHVFPPGIADCARQRPAEP
jgi:hypothetical protein